MMPPTPSTTPAQGESKFSLWSLLGLAPMLLKFLGVDLFGGNNNANQTTQQITYEQPRGIQDPYAALYMQALANSLLKGMKFFGNFGFPAGMGFNTPFTGDIMNLLGRNWPDLLSAYQGRIGRVGRTTPQHANNNPIVSA